MFSLAQSRPRSWQEGLLKLFSRHEPSGAPQERYFWVLKDIDLEVYQGETVSLIGSNGAGKSTLLKLLANIIRPTHGTIYINGRVAALLELGAGFHLDLTGRENIYLSGSMAGMSRAEVGQRLQDIIEFADIGRFIDVPVRHYSSGMFVRLGFALAIHVNPDILVVDEVLAVGDESFQRKCIEKIHETRHRGATVILVSHNMNVIRAMSDRVVRMKKGRIEQIGKPDEVVQAYLADHQASLSGKDKTETSGSGNKTVEITHVEFFNGENKPVTVLETGQPAIIRINYIARQRVERPIFGLAIHRSDDIQINGPNTDVANYIIDYIEGCGALEYDISFLPLLSGTYFVTVGVFDSTHTVTYDFCDRAFNFIVQQQAGSKEMYGLVYIPAQWRQVNPYR